MSTRTPAFTVQADAVERAYHVAPRGELDLLTADRVRTVLADRPDPCDVVVLDLRELTFVDTTGLRLVIETLQDLRAAGVRFALLRGTWDVQRLFELARMDDRLPFFDDLADALAA